MIYETLLVERRGPIAVVTMNRPEKLNAWNDAMMDEFGLAFPALDADPGVAAIVVTGAGRAYCAGADVGALGTRVEERASQGEFRNVLNWADMIRALGTPTICAINGLAVGAGLSSTLSCDIRIASPAARFAMSFVRIGIVPELMSTHLLPQIVGLHAATELMLTGRQFDAEEALRLGLVLRLVEPGRLIDEAVAIGEAIAGSPPSAIRLTRGLIQANASDPDFEAVHERERDAIHATLGSPESLEALAAFREKRRPNFTGLAR